MTFEKNQRTAASRLKERIKYDEQVIYPILDEAIACTVSYQVDGQVFSIPNSFCRIGDTVYIHGSSKSHLLSMLSEGLNVCVSVIHLDGLVLARSVFHHSMNYRSAVLFGKSFLVEDDTLKWEVLKAFTDKIVPGRWEDARQPSAGEMKATHIIGIKIEDASAKVRTGPASDDKQDMDLPVWAGVLPLKKGYEQADRNPDLASAIELPTYLEILQSK